MGIKVSEFGKTSKGKIAHIYTLVNGKGMALEVTDYGATMVSILAPDAKGRSKDVLLGYDDVQDYEQGTCYFGAIIGRNVSIMSVQTVNRDCRVRLISPLLIH